MKHVFIATPTHGGGVSPEYVSSLFATQGACLHSDIAVTHSFIIGNALIHDARNRLAAWFLASEATDLFFIDDDISWRAEDLVRLVRSPHDFIGGAYMQKREDAEMFNVGGLRAGSTRLMQCDFLGTGFLKVSRKALETMVKANADSAYQDLDGNPTYGLFQVPIGDGRIVGEDAYFCQSWRDTGGKVFVDPDVELTHFGRKGYRGSLAALMARAQQEKVA